MKRLSETEKGFSAAELVLGIIIVILICAVGWLVYDNHHKTTEASAKPAPAAPSKPATPTQPSNPYTGWDTATLKYEGITFQYPANWTLADSSTPTPKVPVGCVYPGSDKATIIGPNNVEVQLITGMDVCGGAAGDKTQAASIPITVLGSSDYISIQEISGSTTQIVNACVNGESSSVGVPVTHSKHIYMASGGGLAYNSYCYTNTTDTTVADMEADPSFATAKLIFESMKY